MAKTTLDRLAEKLSRKEHERSCAQARINRWQEQIAAETERIHQIDSDVEALKGEMIMNQISVSKLSLEQVLRLLTENALPEELQTLPDVESVPDVSGAEPAESSAWNDPFFQESES